MIVAMSMSLDGFIAGRNDGPSNALGDGGAVLHQWMFGEGASTPGGGLLTPDQDLFDELRSSSGAMIAGRRLYDTTDGWGGSHPFSGISLFVLSHNIPRDIPSGTTAFTFVTDGVTSAVNQAKRAAGEKDVYVVGGASLDQQLLAAGLVDELWIAVVPVLLGDGVRLFESLGPIPIVVEQRAVMSSSKVAHLRYAISQADSEPDPEPDQTSDVDAFLNGVGWVGSISRAGP